MIMYGAQVSYFSGKLRAYLDWKGLDYQEQVASRDIYVTKIIPNIGWPVIPVIEQDDGSFLQDTTEIIRYFEATRTQPAVLPKSPILAVVSMMLELYGDEWLVLPAMHYRWHYNREFAVAQFGALSAPEAGTQEQLKIGEKVATPFANALPILGVSDKTAPAIEESYLTLLAELDYHFTSSSYLLGDAPTLGDFGLYGPLYAHLYRDPNSGAIMQSRAPNVVAWIERIRDNVDRNTQLSDSTAIVPETLLPVLQRAVREQLPVLMDTVEQLEQFAATAETGKLPRMIGFHNFTIGKTTGQRGVFPYCLWMLQHIVDYLAGLSSNDRRDVSVFLQSIGADRLDQLALNCRVKRNNFKLVLDDFPEQRQ